MRSNLLRSVVFLFSNQHAHYKHHIINRFSEEIISASTLAHDNSWYTSLTRLFQRLHQKLVIRFLLLNHAFTSWDWGHYRAASQLKSYPEFFVFYAKKQMCNNHCHWYPNSIIRWSNSTDQMTFRNSLTSLWNLPVNFLHDRSHLMEQNFCTTPSKEKKSANMVRRIKNHKMAKKCVQNLVCFMLDGLASMAKSRIGIALKKGQSSQLHSKSTQWSTGSYKISAPVHSFRRWMYILPLVDQPNS